MFFWFAGLSFLTVVVVFGSAAIDYRLVMLGAVLPTVEHLWGGPWIMHTLLFAAGAMTVIMIGAQGKRLVQRKWLGFAIGIFLHLVFAGSWRLTSLFWWPGFGTSLDPDHVPSLPPAGILVVMELVGLVVLVWAWKRFALSEPARRKKFVESGNLDRALMGAKEPGQC